MSYLFSTVLTAAQEMFNDLVPAKVLELGNAAHAKICRHVKLYEDDVVLMPMTAGMQKQPLDSDILRVWTAYLYTGSTSFIQLLDWSIDEGDYKEFGWRGAVPGQPFRGFIEGSKFGCDPIPDTSTPTIAITNATSAAPIVISAAHGLSASGNGTPANAVAVSGVGGLLTANGTFYGQYLSAGTLGLYKDVDQTIPVDGTGGPSYTSGGLLTTTNSYPLIEMFVQKRRTLALTDYLPAQVLYFDAWLDEIAFLWSLQRHRDQAPQLQQQAMGSLNRLSWEIMGRPVRLKPTTVFNAPLVRH